ncbi:MAG: DUF5060 domain-containing protein [Armatimonadetes bacterium]|nr:DUF5060 domain-containing protein [Armatimonadota bacterium]
MVPLLARKQSAAVAAAQFMRYVDGGNTMDSLRRWLRLAAIVEALVFFIPGVSSAQVRCTVTDTGVIRELRVGDATLARDTFVNIVKPDWKGSWARQDEAMGVQVQCRWEGAKEVFTGSLQSEVGPVAFAETVTSKGDEVKVEYSLTPTARLEGVGIVLMMSLPVEGHAGTTTWIASDDRTLDQKLLPAQLDANNYHVIHSEEVDWFGWMPNTGEGLQVTGDGKGITGGYIQDDRKFGSQVFGIHCHVSGSSVMEAGKKVTFGLSFRPLTKLMLDRTRAATAEGARSLLPPLTSKEKLRLGSVKPSSSRVKLYEPITFGLDLSATFDNPFDPGDIDVSARITTPSRKTITVPGFYYQGYERYQKGTAERLTRLGDPGWKVRFAPPELGKHTVVVTARDRTGQVISKPIGFMAVASDSRGFVRRSPQTPYYLQFDNGTPYFAVGWNVCWAGRSGRTYDYDKWLPALGRSGGNYARIWLVRWNLGMEWSSQDPDCGNEFPGLGKYSLTNAWRLDQVMETARQSGIYVMLCQGYHGELMDTKAYFGEDRWQLSPYNSALGGPCQTPKEFWSSEEAKKLYQRRLRYMIARYGGYANVLSWEFWNEVFAPVEWIKPMEEFMIANDPYHHLITTTYGDDKVWQLKEMDYTQTHSYGSDDMLHDCTGNIAADSRDYTEKFGKPYMMGEFGIDWKTSDAKHDVNNIGTNLHNGMWASVMQRSFGAAAVWYWEEMHVRDNYHHLTAVRRFVDTIPWNRLNSRIARFSHPTAQAPQDAPWRDLHFQAKLGWAKATGTDFALRNDGTLEGNGEFSSVLFSDSKADMKTPLRFHVNLVKPGKLGFHVGLVSNTAVIHVRVDGQEVWTKEFVAGDGVGAFSKFHPEWGDLWQSDFNQDFEVEIPTGEHTIELENTGKDHATLSQYWLTSYLDPTYARIDILGLSTDTLSLVWLHNQDSNWYSDSKGLKLEKISGMSCDLLDLPDGNYTIQWWDTWKGKPIAETKAKCEKGRLPLSPPVFVRDVAAKVSRVRGQ